MSEIKQTELDIRREVLRKLSVGDPVKVENDGRGLTIKREKLFRIVAFYPHHALCIEEETGFRSSFQYFDLLIAAKGGKMIENRPSSE